ncbi:hypothetical protein [Streptomyces noursei]|nr:hypothetical protein [Streptomyces noursei]
MTLRSWMWVPCPHGCGYVDEPETDPDTLYRLFSSLDPRAPFPDELKWRG